ncbi:hypothetical protein [Niallia nealsonii]|nr:hypothetical protein [Niallia nealsonii]
MKKEKVVSGYSSYKGSGKMLNAIAMDLFPIIFILKRKQSKNLATG